MSELPLSRTRSIPAAILLAVATFVSSVASIDRHLSGIASTTESTLVTTEPTRGTIYDRSGRIALARSEPLGRLVADRTATTEEATRIATIISRVSGRPFDTLMSALLEGDGWRIVDREPFSGETLSALRELETDGALAPARLEPLLRRVHMDGGGAEMSLAAQLLGFVDADGVGHYGIESYYDELLSGSPQVERVERDGSRSLIEVGRDGADLILSIDAGLQRVVERIASETHRADKALGVTIVAMDLATGEILASASSPAYDGSSPAALGDGGWSDPLVSRPFDPGSVIKPFSILAALDAGVASETTLFDDRRRLYMEDGSGSVGNWDGGSAGRISVGEALTLSRNVITSLLALGLGPTPQEAAKRLVSLYTAFGLGAETGIDLANESGGVIRDPSSARWRAIDVANASFGQGVSISPISLLAAYGALGNGGVLVRPRVVTSIDGEPVPITVRGRAVDPALAARARALLETTFNDPGYRTARERLPEGWSGGGKTGTAEIYDYERDEWLRGLANFSMGGWIGREAPEVAILVTIWRAKPSGSLFYLPVSSRQLWGLVAAEIAARIDDRRLVLSGGVR